MKALCTTLPSNDLGLLTRSLPVARELAGRGHQVAFCNPAEAPGMLIAEAGFENRSLAHPVFQVQMKGQLDLRGLYRQLTSEPLRRAFGGPVSVLIELLRSAPVPKLPLGKEVWDMDHFAAMTGMLNGHLVRAAAVAYARTIKAYDPDVVIDFWNPFACLAARILRKPLVTVIQADMHPASRGFIWWKGPPPAEPRPASNVNAVLAAHGLAPIRKVADLFLGDLTLVLGMPETDPLPPGVDATYVGPILWRKAGAAMPDWFDALRTDRPVIWAYSGNPRYLPVRTPVDSEIVLHACVAALAAEGVQVVLTTGHHALPRGLLPLPANFTYASFVPGLAMAERSDLLIHHGGYGSCQTGLYTGTPAVIVPTYAERESNARRVAAVGAGAFVLPAGYATRKKRTLIEELRTAVRQVLSDPAYAAHARRISREMRAYGGAPEAARRIERFCQNQGIEAQ